VTVTYQSAGAVATTSGTSIGVVAPASIAADDLLVMIVGMKPSSVGGGVSAIPHGWALLTSVISNTYGATLGVDTGDTILWVYSKKAVGNESSTTVTAALSGTSVCWGQIYRLSKDVPGDLWTVAVTVAQDSSAGNVSMTFDGDVGVAAGDVVIGAMCIPTDNATFSAEALSVPGVTVGTVTEVSEPASTLGNDIGGFVVRAPITAGASSGVPTLTATAGGTTTNVRGPGVFIRARHMPDFSDVVEDFEDTSYSVAPSGVWARSSTSADTGSWSLKAPATGNSATSNATFTVPAGATQMAFSYRVSSEAGFDIIDVYFNSPYLAGNVIELIDSGDSGWRHSVAYDVTPGQTVKFDYTKDSSGTGFLDTAFIDNLRFKLPLTSVSAGAATGVGAANAGVCAMSASAGVAAASGSSLGPSPKVAALFGALYPSTDLYPSTGLYPNPGACPGGVGAANNATVSTSGSTTSANSASAAGVSTAPSAAGWVRPYLPLNGV